MLYTAYLVGRLHRGSASAGMLQGWGWGNDCGGRGFFQSSAGHWRKGGSLTSLSRTPFSRRDFRYWRRDLHDMRRQPEEASHFLGKIGDKRSCRRASSRLDMRGFSMPSEGCGATAKVRQLNRNYWIRAKWFFQVPFHVRTTANCPRLPQNVCLASSTPYSSPNGVFYCRSKTRKRDIGVL